MTTRKTSTGECDACRRILGLWQAVFTSECAHTFHLRCVSGTAVACPVCAARWTDTPVTAPAPTPTTPYAFASSTTPSRTPVFGQLPWTSCCFWPPPPPTSPPWTPMFGSSTAASQAFNLSGAYSPFVGRRIPEFGQQQQQQQRRCAPAAPQCPVCHGTKCSVCHGAIRRGQAAVTSECNHTFHLRCVASHDCARSVCPVCRVRWRDCVSLALQPQPLPPAVSFDDDEPPPLLLLDQVQSTTNKDDDQVVRLKTRCEHPAVARDTARDSFAVLVHAKAPPEHVAAPLDMVTLLDVSGSMAGDKLALLKQAMSFVIDRLGPRDRLSIVAFSCEARRILGFTLMSDGGKATAKAAVESLVTQAGTDIGEALRVATEVLDGRRHRNAVAGVILLSDGKDNHNYHHPNCLGRINRYSGLAPRSLTSTLDCQYPPPVHMFALGTDHGDAEAMHAIARATRGSLSVIDDKEAVVQDSLARCIGRLRSVAVQDARVVVECLHPGVHVRAVKVAGRHYYPSLIDGGGRAASVDVGELYADEERRFLLFLGVPPVGVSVTRLIKVSCTYKDPATGRSVDVCCKDDTAVLRPVVVPATTTDMDVEVARERFRVEAAEDIGQAQDALKHGEHARAAQILDRWQEAMAAGLAGDDKCAELVAELRELSARVAADRRWEWDFADGAPRVPAFRAPAGPPATQGGFLLTYRPFVPSFGSYRAWWNSEREQHQ